ncbi:MAG: NfeD family protein [Deltaproteobacteria bacterium]|nr:NfeD family protein [Deltaproteobacteria bacterium]
MILLSFYAGAGVFGLVLIGASAIGFDKSHEAEVHADGHLDMKAEPDTHFDGAKHDGVGDDGEIGALAATLLSMRFWTFFLASFGLTGVLLHLVGLGWYLSLPLALAMGVGIGVAVAHLFRLANKRSVGTIADTQSLLGKEGTVVIAVEPGKAGKIKIEHDGQTVEFLAHTTDRRLERGERVIVAEMKGGEATVTPVAPAAPVPA